MKPKYFFSALIVGVFAWLFTVDYKYIQPKERIGKTVEECDCYGGNGGQASVDCENCSSLGGSPTDLPESEIRDFYTNISDPGGAGWHW